MPGYKVLITVSGTGSRLGDLTKDKNKSVIALAGRTALDFILDSYDSEIPLVFTVGYLGEQVIEFVAKNYSERKVEFVRVSPFEGPGSSLGYSMSCAAPLLQCPFVFHACDTIVIEPIPAPDVNWVGGYVPNPEEFARAGAIYRTHKFNGNKLVKVNNKGATDFESVHIGLIGIKDYRVFWESLDGLLRSSDPDNTAWSDVHVIEKMLEKGADFQWVPYKVWFDTGNLEDLKKAEEYLKKTGNT